MKKSSDKNFGILFFIVFFLISVWPLFSLGPIRLWSLFLSIIFLVLAILKPVLLKPHNNIWLKLGEMLGKVVAPLVMMVIFFLILTPISLIVRAFGKDLLKLRAIKKNSYWIKRENNINSMDKQF